MTHSAKGFKAPPKWIPVGLVPVFFLALWSASAQVQTAPEPGPRVARTSGDFIVTFQPGTSQADRAASVRRAGAALRFNYGIVDAVAVTIPNTNVYAALQRDPSVLEIIPDRPVFAIHHRPGHTQGGGDSGAGQITPEGVKRVGLSESGNDGAGVGVAILDTGIDLAHTDLALGSGSYTAYSSCQDGDGHGTHVTGIVAALNNTQGVVGVAPAATAYCAKVLDDSGSGSDATVMAGLDWVNANASTVNPPIRVVNMSLGRAGTIDDNTTLRQSVANLYNSGIVVVVAAGNDPYAEVEDEVPATYPEVLAVASTTAKDGTNAGCGFFPGIIPADTASYFTTDGQFVSGIGVTISAPGADQEDVTAGCFSSSVGILSLRAGGGTTRMSGTSMASPHVAGIVARLIQVEQLTPSTGSDVEYIRDWLRHADNADRVGEAPLDSPTTDYTFDNEREGIAQAPQLGGPNPPPGSFTLNAQGYKVQGLQKADLSWSGATSPNVDIYRDNTIITTTANDGFYTDNINNRGGGSYTYKVCEVGSTTTCSNEAVVSF